MPTVRFFHHIDLIWDEVLFMAGCRMDTGMIVIAVVVATVVVFLLEWCRRYWRKSRFIGEVKAGIGSLRAFRETYPTLAVYEAHVVREWRIQEAEDGLLKTVLGKTYETVLSKAYRLGETPAHFTDRWLYAIAAPKRWDFMEGILPYYSRLSQWCLKKGIRPTALIRQCGGMTSFIQCVEAGFAQDMSPEAFVRGHVEKK